MCLKYMIDQANNLIRLIKESETARICNLGHSVVTTDNTKKLRESLQKYAKDELKPQIEKAITKLEKLFKPYDDRISEHNFGNYKMDC